MAKHKIQSIIVRAFEYGDDGLNVGTIVSVRLDKPLTVAGGSDSACENIQLVLLSDGSPDAIINGVGRGIDWQDTSSASSDDEDESSNDLRIFHFHLDNLPIATGYNYTLQIRADVSKDFVALTFKSKHGERRRKTQQAAVKLALNTPRFARDQKATSLHLVTGGDQEEMPQVFSDQRHATTRIYSCMADVAPDAFMHLGDVFYGEKGLINQNPVVRTASFLSEIEHDFAAPVRGSLASIPATRVLDDHDLGRNAVTSHHQAEPGVKNAIQVFKDFWPSPEGDDQQGNGLYYEVIIGDVHLFHLHNRLYADTTSLLGAKQYQWLEQRLLDTQGVKFVVSPLPFAMGKKPEEDYRSNAAEWSNLLRLFAATGVKAILTADSHNYSRTDFTVSLHSIAVTIPHFIVGSFGGRAQALTKSEYESMVKSGKPEIPRSKSITASVATYYGGKARFGSHIVTRRNRQYSGKTGEVTKVRRDYGYLDLQLAPGADSSTRRRLQATFFTTANKRTGSSGVEFDRTDFAEYEGSENEDERYYQPHWPTHPISWKDMEIESKWDISLQTYQALIDGLPDNGSRFGFGLNVRWSGKPRVFVDRYYDQEGQLQDSMHNLRFRARYTNTNVDEWQWKPGDRALFTEFDANVDDSDLWRLDWHRVQYKTQPSRLAATWFRYEVGDCRTYDRRGRGLCASCSDNLTTNYLGVLKHERKHDGMSLMRADHPDVVINPESPAITVTDFRYRVVLGRNEIDEDSQSVFKPLYEISLDHLRSKNHKTGKVTVAFEAELELLVPKEQRTTEDVLGLFRVAEKLAWKYDLQPSIKTKGGVKVPDLADATSQHTFVR